MKARVQRARRQLRESLLSAARSSSTGAGAVTDVRRAAASADVRASARRRVTSRAGAQR